MSKIPFSVYDFFGYLAAGFILLIAIDYSFNGGSLLKKDNLTIIQSIVWILAAYITGQIVANIAGDLIERRIVRNRFQSPEELLFQAPSVTGWRRIFPGFHQPLPIGLQERILQKAKARAGIDTPCRSLFLHCHTIVKHDQVTKERLDTFLNLYGFCRNVCMAALLAVVILFADSIFDWISGRGIHPSNLWWSIAALLVAMGTFYRYLKFFRHYTAEVFTTYAEAD